MDDLKRAERKNLQRWPLIAAGAGSGDWQRRRQLGLGRVQAVGDSALHGLRAPALSLLERFLYSFVINRCLTRLTSFCFTGLG